MKPFCFQKTKNNNENSEITVMDMKSNMISEIKLISFKSKL